MRCAPVLLLAALLLGPSVRAQSATVAEPGPAADRYHEAARLYIEGEIERAAVAADAGLALAPRDARMHALRELIRRNEPQGGGGGPENEPPLPGGGGEDDGDAPPEPDGQGAPPEGPPDDAAPPASDRAPQPSPRDGRAGGAPERPGQMSPEQAERLLDAVGGEEQLLLRSMRREPSRVRRNDKTW